MFLPPWPQDELSRENQTLRQRSEALLGQSAEQVSLLFLLLLPPAAHPLQDKIIASLRSQLSSAREELQKSERAKEQAMAELEDRHTKEKKNLKSALDQQVSTQVPPSLP